MNVRQTVTRWESETLAYRARIVVAGGAITDAHLWAINTFIRTCKRTSIWDKLMDVGPLAGASLTAALRKLKYPTGISSAVINHSFISGDYGAATGLTGNGTTKYLQLGTRLGDYLNNAGHISVYVRTAPSGSTTRDAIGIENAGIGYRFDGATNVMHMDWGTAAHAAFGSAATGFWSGTGRATGARSLYRNGANPVTANAASTTFINREFYLFANSNDGGASRFWSGAISFYSIGGVLSAAEHLELYTAVLALQTALGRNV